MRKILIILVNLLLVLPQVAAQKDTTVELNDSFKKKLLEQSSATQSIVCKFRETKQIAMIEKPVVATGNFFYKKENNLALIYDDPKGDQIVMSNGKFKITSGGKTNVVSMNANSMLRQMNNMLTACFVGDISLLTAGAQSNYSETADTHQVEIRPTRKKVRDNMAVIWLVFDKQDMSLNSMKIESASGDYTEYQFTDKVLNAEVGTEHFNL